MLMFNIQPLPSTFGPTPIFLNDRHVLCCDIVLTSPPQLVCVCVCVCVCVTAANACLLKKAHHLSVCTK